MSSAYDDLPFGFEPDYPESPWAYDEAPPDDHTPEHVAASVEKSKPQGPSLWSKVRDEFIRDNDVVVCVEDSRVYALPKSGLNRTAVRLTGAAVHRAIPEGWTMRGLQAASKEAHAWLEARAETAAPRRSIALRVHQDSERIVLDLGVSGSSRCVVVTPDGWTIHDVPPLGVAFRRMAATQPLPDPTHDGRLDGLRVILGWRKDDARWLLAVGWLTASLMASIPRPLIAALGEAGSGKSSVTRLLTDVFDPRPPHTSGSEFGKSLDDEVVKSAGRYLVTWDNLSTVSETMSNYLCRVVTGDMYEKRTLYSDADVSTLSYRRTGVLTAIHLPPNMKPDALDRVLRIPLDTRTDRVSEAQMDEQWASVRPEVMGRVLDLAATMLERFPVTSRDPAVTERTRMSDYCAALAAIGSEFADAYVTSMAEGVHEDAFEDTFVMTVLEFVTKTRPGRWTPAELHDKLRHVMFEGSVPQWWPQSPTSLSRKVEESKGRLRVAGVEVTRPKSNGIRWIELALTGGDRDAR